jgi:hypothetical protein
MSGQSGAGRFAVAGDDVDDAWWKSSSFDQFT